MERSNGGRKTAISRCTPVKNCGDADVRRVAGRSSGCERLNGEQVRGSDAATWRRSTVRASPEGEDACPIRNAGKRNGDMWQLRPEIGVVTWRMVHTGRPIRMRHVAPVKAILTAVLRWHKENISCLNIYFNIFSKKEGRAFSFESEGTYKLKF